ncbi:MAG TPA: hypothetical protein VJ783_18350 [Pirellulales bacterium]|nr:hypothetical protein [Pirellulales bacterium]
MKVNIRGSRDECLNAIANALDEYGRGHPASEIDVYRVNSASIHARIIDPDFKGISRADRHEIVWKFLEPLPDDVQSHMSVLLLLTPDEKKKSYASVEFDDPVSSRI